MNYGPKCGSGVIESCAYDGPGAALKHIYGGVAPLIQPANADAWNNASLVQYDQAPFFSADNNGTAVWNATTPRATGERAQSVVSAVQ
jgi:hypothetical protein